MKPINTSCVPIYLMTSTENIYQVDGRLYGGTEQQNVNASFTANTILLLNDDNDITLAEQTSYLNDGAKAGFYAWSPLVTKDKLVRIKVTLSPVQGKLQAFAEQSYSSGLAYALSCSLHMALKQSWCEASAMPQTPYFCTGRVSVSGEIGAVGDIIKKVSEALKFISAQVHSASTIQAILPKKPLFYILLPKSNYDPNTQLLTSESKSEESQNDWQALVKKVEELGGKLAGITSVSEGLALILGDAFIASSEYGIEQEPLGLRAINYENRRHFFGRKLRVTELAESANKAYLTASALTVSGISGSGKSSLVQAGLLPELMKKDNGLNIPRIGRKNHATVKPSEHNNLAGYLKPLLEILSTKQALLDDWLAQPLHELSGTLKNFIEESHASAKEDSVCETDVPYSAWILDQYEELFHTNHITPEEVTQLSQFLREMAATKHIFVITIVRLEYYSHSGVVAGERFTLLDQDKAKEFQQILKEHQQFFGVEMASQNEQSSNLLHRQPLEARILGDVSHVPLSSLAFLLQKLYEKMKEHAPSSGLYTHDYYDALLGIEGVMTNQAELALKEGLFGIPEALHKDISDAFFEAFVGIDENEMPIVKVVLNSHIDNFQVADNSRQRKIETIWPLVNAFMSKGLISDCGNGVVSKLKLSHDSIIIVDENRAHWMTMVQWFQTNTTYIKWAKTIDGRLRDWLVNGKQNKFLINDKEEINVGQSFSKRGHNASLKQFIKTAAAQRRKRLGRITAATVLFITGGSYFSYSVNDGYTKLAAEVAQKTEKLGFVEEELTFKQEELKQEISSRREIVELELKSLLINHIAELGLYIPDEVVINNTDAVRQVVRNLSLTLLAKQQLLDSITQGGSETNVAASQPAILKELESKGFIFDIELVKKMPELHRLVLETSSMDDKERQWWLNVMPSITDEQIDKLFNILDVERNKLAALEEKYKEEIVALNRKYEEKLKDSQVQKKGREIPSVSLKKKLLDTMSLLTNDVTSALVSLNEIIEIEKNNRTWVSIDAYAALGQSLFEQHQYEKALNYFSAELELREELDMQLDNLKLSSKYWSMSVAHEKLQSFEQAISYSHIAIKYRSKLLQEPENYHKNIVERKLEHLWANIVTYNLVINKQKAAKKALVSQLKYSKQVANFIVLATHSYDEKIFYNEQSILLYESLIEENKYDNVLLKKTQASRYGNLSWYYLFVNNPEQSMLSAKKGLKLSPEKLWIKGNLAHANLFLGNYDKALMGYKFNYKNKINDKQTFLEATFADFKLFKEAGLTHPDLDRMIKEISKFKI